MKRKEIEKRLTIAVSNSVPDVLDNIFERCEKTKGFEKKGKRKKDNDLVINKKMMIIPKLSSVLALILIFVFGVIGANHYNSVYKVEATIEFDVNPSIEIEVNKKEEIIKVKALNEDGNIVLNDMNLKGVELNVGVNAIIGSMLRNGYLSVDYNSILVSVKDDDVEKGEQLQQKLLKEIEEILKASSIEGAILTQAYNDDGEILEMANKYGISEGKAELINRILESGLKDKNGNLYTIESLAKLSINDLKLLLDAKDVKLDNVDSSGSASDSSYMDKDKIKEIVFEDAGIRESDVDDLEIELDADDGKMIYELEFRVGKKEYEYEVSAKDGTILDKEIDIDD